jgi:HK97 family phage portal protein
MSLWRNEKRDIPMSAPLRAWGQGDVSLSESAIDTALRLIPVYAAVSLIVDSIAIMPVHIYQDGPGGRKVLMPEQPALVDSPHPNSLFTRVEWVQQFGASFLLRGNAYGYIVQTDNAGTPTKIAWLNPDSVRVDESGALPEYYQGEKKLDKGRLIHIPWFPKPGSVVGLSPIGQFKAQFETTSLASGYGRSWFKQSGVPKGHLKFAAGPLDTEQATIAKDRFKAAVSGNDIFVSGNDWDWKALSVAPNEAQFLETIQAGATEVAAIFRVSPEDIGGKSGDSLTYSTLEMAQLRLQTRALQPVFTRLEAHMKRVVPPGQYYKFNPDALIRTDIKARMEAYQIALNAGIYTQDFVRDKEDQAPMTKREREAWKELYGSKGGANGANPVGNPSGTQQPQTNPGGGA